MTEMIGHNRVHHRGGLVVKDALRLRGQGSRDGNGALEASGQIRRIGIVVFFQIHHLEEAAHDLLAITGVVVLAQFERKEDILAHRHRVEQSAGLEDHGDLPPDPAQLILRRGGNVGMGHDNLALVRLQESHDVAQRNRFADAAAPDDGDGLAGINVKIHVDQNGPVKRLIHMAELNVVGKRIRHHAPPAKARQSSGVLTLVTVPSVSIHR